MADGTVSVTRAQTLAAQLLLRLERAAGIQPSDRVEKVAEAGLRAGVQLPPAPSHATKRLLH